MNKSELVRVVAERLNLPKTTVNNVANELFNVVVDGLREGQEVTLPVIGKMVVSYRKEREGCDPRTRSKIIIPARYVPALKASKELKEAVADISVAVQEEVE